MHLQSASTLENGTSDVYENSYDCIGGIGPCTGTPCSEIRTGRLRPISGHFGASSAALWSPERLMVIRHRDHDRLPSIVTRHDTSGTAEKRPGVVVVWGVHDVDIYSSPWSVWE